MSDWASPMRETVQYHRERACSFSRSCTPAKINMTIAHTIRFCHIRDSVETLLYLVDSLIFVWLERRLVDRDALVDVDNLIRWESRHDDAANSTGVSISGMATSECSRNRIEQRCWGDQTCSFLAKITQD